MWVTVMGNLDLLAFAIAVSLTVSEHPLVRHYISDTLSSFNMYQPQILLSILSFGNDNLYPPTYQAIGRHRAATRKFLLLETVHRCDPFQAMPIKQDEL
jgi:hypothetical protein